jgi:hypothetical protein
MRAVAERLFFRKAAGAPPVFSRFQFQKVRHFAGYLGLTHVFALPILNGLE